MSSLVLTLDISFGQFIVGETVSSGSILSTIKSLNQIEKTITIDEPEVGTFEIGKPIVGLTSLATGIILTKLDINPLDLLNIFSSTIPKDFSFSDFIQGIASDPEINLISTDLIPNLSSTKSLIDRDVISDPSVVVDTVINAIRKNPLNPETQGLAIPNDRHRTNIANEPTDKFEGEYPYNKSYRSESGHLIEIDDTPGKERLLNQHITGTYTEMKSDGNLVTKVIKDNYTIVCGEDFVTIEGRATVHVTGDCQLRVGGFLTIVSDMGINVSTKGDFRLKARSINMESTSGDISSKSANNMLFTTAETTHLKTKKNLIESIEETSITTGQQFIVESNKISQKSKTDIVIESEAKTNIISKGNLSLVTDATLLTNSKNDTNIKSGGRTKVSASTLEVDATLNVRSGTNMRAASSGGDSFDGWQGAGVNHQHPVIGQGAQAAAAAAKEKIEPAIKPAESKGSGITFVEDPDKTIEAIDDDPDEAIIAIKDALDKGTIRKEELDERPPEDGETDSAQPPSSGDRRPLLNSPTIKDVGTTPPDNLRLSTNFTLGQVSKHAIVTRHPVVAQQGLTVEQIVQNLQLVTQNCLEKIKTKYPDMIVTSGFRRAPTNRKSKSQHLVGQAIDMQFTNATKRDYYAIAQWIKENVPYDQLLLEYKSTGTKLPWIHISFKGTGNRNQVLTFWNDAVYAQGLKNLGGKG